VATQPPLGACVCRRGVVARRAAGASLRGGNPAGVAVGLVLPAVLLLLCALTLAALPLWGIYGLQALRVGRNLARDGRHPAPWRHGVYLVLGRFPEALGALTFYWRRWRRGPVRLIEYK